MPELLRLQIFNATQNVLWEIKAEAAILHGLRRFCTSATTATGLYRVRLHHR